MKRLHWLGWVAVSVVGLSGCASTQHVPRELMAARDAYNRAASGPSAEMAPAQLHTAKIALDKAEGWYQEDPEAQETRDFAYIAERKAQLAEAQAGIQLANQQRENAERTLRLSQEQAGMAAQEELRRTRAQLAKAEARTKEVLSRLDGMQDKVKEDDRGLVITLSGSVLFGSGKSVLLPAARAQLDEIARALVGAKAESISVEGFTDGSGSETKNAQLSQARASAVLQYLASKGVASERMQAVGRGASNPIASNATVEGRASNRRVEIVVQGTAAARR